MGRASKDKRDIYYRKAKEQGYRARSAFKLVQIIRHFHLLHGVRRVVDLCSAPGGWTEVLSQELGVGASTTPLALVAEGGEAAAAASSSTSPSFSSSPSPSSLPPRIVAVDLQMMAPLPGVTFIQGDLTRASTAKQILEALQDEETSSSLSGKNETADTTTSSASSPSPSPISSSHLAELVVCDGAPDVIGLHDVDELIQFELLLAAFNISLHVLKGGGVGAFVAKIFRGKGVGRMYALFQKYFTHVSISKPKACRNSSVEGFVVCQGYRGLAAVGEGWRSMEQPVRVEEVEEEALQPVPFVSCWDEEQLDSDMSYPLTYTFKERRGNRKEEGGEEGAAMSSVYQELAPAVLPIDPPYKRSLQMKKSNMFQKQ